jgi:hypothetical protein
MNDPLGQYLADSYRRDILVESVEVAMPAPDPALIQEVEKEIADIDALRLGSNLASRSFCAYQNRRALVALLQQLRAARQEAEKQEAGKQVPEG